MNNPVIHFEINVYNAKRARTFYQKLLGWKIAKIDKKMSHASISRSVTMYVQVKNIEAVFKKVKKLGGKVTRRVMEIPGTGRIGWFRDQAGNEIGLWSMQK